MGKLIGVIVIVLLLANSLALVGLLGYGMATGRLDKEERGQYLATWRGEKLVRPSVEEEVEQVEEAPRQARAKIAAAEEAQETLTVQMQRQREQIRNMKAAIDSAKAKLQDDRNKLDADKEQFEIRLAQQQKMTRDEGFRKALKIFSQMKPKYVKDEFMQMDDKDVVRFVAAMKSDTATGILERFKTPQEREKRNRIMALLETGRRTETGI